MSEPSQRIASLRQQFPGTERWIYMDVAARGLLSKRTHAAMVDYMDMRMLEGGDKADMFEHLEATRDRFARFINADPIELAWTKNTSEGINAFANSLNWRAGDNVVVCEALEHPANVFVWHNLQALRGVELKVVPPDNGRIPFEALLEAIDGRTRLVSVSSVSFSPGLRFPLAELAAACRDRGVLVLVDAAQSVGILHTDVAELGIDALATSTQKGLLGLYGAGLLYVRRAVAETLHPAYLSRPGVAVASTHEASSGDLANYALAPGARRFDVGNPNFIAAVALEHSLQDLQAIGTTAVEAHCCGLARRLADGLREAGLPVFGGTDVADSAHIVALGNGLSDEHDTTADQELAALSAFLLENRVRHTIRRGMLRLSVHVYNNEGDVEAVLELARRWMARQGGTRPARVSA